MRKEIYAPKMMNILLDRLFYSLAVVDVFAPVRLSVVSNSDRLKIWRSRGG
jgi:hypothetical protein